MTPTESNILRYLEAREWASTHGLARHFTLGLSSMELIMRSLLRHGQVEEDARRYYRITQHGKDSLTTFDDQWIIKPFDDSRRPI